MQKRKKDLGSMSEENEKIGREGLLNSGISEEREIENKQEESIEIPVSNQEGKSILADISPAEFMYAQKACISLEIL